MFKKFAEAIGLLHANLPLFSAIILTVWLPGNLLLNYLAFNVPTDDQVIRAGRTSMFIEAVFGPIYSAGLIHALWKLKDGQRPGYFEAIGTGWRTWGRLFSARFLTGLWITFGLIVFIVPGLVLLVRYALLDPVVVLEGAGADGARRRSTELTRGIRWQILAAGLLFFAVFLPIPFLIAAVLEHFPRLDTMATGVVLDCALDVLYAIIQIVLFLYYWEAVTLKQPSAELADLAEG